jgi:hypothetical protein
VLGQSGQRLVGVITLVGHHVSITNLPIAASRVRA